MTWSHTTPYVPYGAYELKATYQRNMLFGMVSILILTGLLITIGSVVIKLTRPGIPLTPPELVAIDIKFIKPPTIIPTHPQIPNPPAPPKSRGSMPVAIPDSLVAEPNRTIPSTEELRAGFGNGSDSGTGPFSVVVPDSEFGKDSAETFPDENEPTIVEKYPAFVHQEKPAYPETARRLGLTGVVLVRVLVDREGKVREAKAFRSSGYDSLDQAALLAAYKCVFTPAIQNGLPKAVWVSYKVVFSLND